MQVKYCSLLIIAFVFSVNYIFAQQKYKGIVVTKLGKEEKGMITVNLNGSNDELIEIETTEVTQSKGRGKKSKQTLTSSMKLNVAFIHHLIINDSTYYIRDIKYGYNDKYYMNVCVRLIAGTLDCGMFQNGKSTGNENLSVKLPNAEFSKLAATEFDYYKATSGWTIMAFGSCPELRSKMVSGQAGYKWDDNTAQEQRLAMWKKWIQEFNACKK